MSAESEAAELVKKLLGGEAVFGGGVEGFDEEPDSVVEGYADDIAREVLASEPTSVEGILDRIYMKAAQKTRKPSTVQKVAGRAAKKVLPHIQQRRDAGWARRVEDVERRVRQAYEEEMGRLKAQDMTADNSAVPFVKLNVAAGNSVTFSYTVQNEQDWVDFVVGKDVAENFVATEFSIGTWEWSKHGGKMEGGDANLIALDDFVQDATGPNRRPLQGRRLAKADNVKLTVQNISAVPANFRGTLKILLREIAGKDLRGVPNNRPAYPALQSF